MTVTWRPADTGRANFDVRKESAMYLLNQELARSHQAELRRVAERESRARKVAAARRWQRKAEAASRRARAASAAVL